MHTAVVDRIQYNAKTYNSGELHFGLYCVVDGVVGLRIQSLNVVRRPNANKHNKHTSTLTLLPSDWHTFELAIL